MTDFQILWFVLIAVLFAGFFFLEGFDFGIGMALKGVAKTEHEEDALIASIGPHWDGNEVWLITAGGAMFAAMPFWYASLFSGFYLILFAILLGLIYRGVSFEFREQMKTAKYRNLWTTISAVTSFFVPFLFGVLFADVVQGMPLDKAGDMSATFFDYFNVFSIIGGVAVALLSYVHGLNYLRLKVETGVLHDRVQTQIKVLYPVLLVGEVAFAAGLFLFTDFFAKKPLMTVAFLAVIVLLTIIAWLTGLKRRNVWSFITLGLAIIAVVLLLFTGLFPRVIVGDVPSMSLLLKNATSSAYTLKWMTIISLTALPIVLAYQIWSFYIFRQRIVVKK